MFFHPYFLIVVGLIAVASVIYWIYMGITEGEDAQALKDTDSEAHEELKDLFGGCLIVLAIPLGIILVFVAIYVIGTLKVYTLD